MYFNVTFQGHSFCVIVFYKSIQYDVGRGNTSQHSVASMRITIQHSLGDLPNINERQQKNFRRVPAKTITW